MDKFFENSESETLQEARQPEYCGRQETLFWKELHQKTSMVLQYCSFAAGCFSSISPRRTQLRIPSTCWVDRRGLPGLSILGMRLVLLCSGGQGVGLGGWGGDNTSLLAFAGLCFCGYSW